MGQYKATRKPVAQIGAELGVSSVLEGSVRKSGDQLRITVQLIDVASDEHRWAKTYERKLANIFAIQAEVAEETANSLRVELLKSEIENIRERPTSNLAAYEAYLRGVRAFQDATMSLRSADEDRVAISHFETAIREDPGFSAAHSYLANYLLGILGQTRPAKDVVPRARELATRALELNPNSADAHTALGNLALQGDQNWTRAEAEFREALRLNPSSSSAHFWFALLLATLQRPEECATHIRSAIDLDPLLIHPRLLEISMASAYGEVQTSVSLAEGLWSSFGENIATRGALAWAYTLDGRE
ncbi:MAG: tetratricopeptide repeat protein, partial [Thermoplasmata archaeon]